MKQIINSRGEVVISNDGATILKQMEVVHPTAKMVRSSINAHRASEYAQTRKVGKWLEKINP